MSYVVELTFADSADNKLPEYLQTKIDQLGNVRAEFWDEEAGERETFRFVSDDRSALEQVIDLYAANDTYHTQQTGDDQDEAYLKSLIFEINL